MMMHDAGIEAKEAAVREVAKLLPLPDSLASVNSIRSDYALRQQVLSAIIGNAAGGIFCVFRRSMLMDQVVVVSGVH